MPVTICDKSTRSERSYSFVERDIRRFGRRLTPNLLDQKTGCREKRREKRWGKAVTIFHRIVPILTVLILVGCGTGNDIRPDASAEVVSSASYSHDGPTALTLYTMINNRSGAGAHTSVMINGSQRVIFDPAGTVRLRSVPERGDVLYGVTPEVADFYARAHARETYHVVIQEVEVSAEVAELALQLAVANGPAASGFCSVSTSALLRQLPGFESIGRTFFPRRLMDDFGKLPGVQTTKLFENDEDDKSLAIAQFERALGTRP